MVDDGTNVIFVFEQSVINLWLNNSKLHIVLRNEGSEFQE